MKVVEPKMVDTKIPVANVPPRQLVRCGDWYYITTTKSLRSGRESIYAVAAGNGGSWLDLAHTLVEVIEAKIVIEPTK